MMTEVEICFTLGILADPDANRVPFHPSLRADLIELKHVFQQTQQQKAALGETLPDMWMQLLPWHSLN